MEVSSSDGEIKPAWCTAEHSAKRKTDQQTDSPVHYNFRQNELPPVVGAEGVGYCFSGSEPLRQPLEVVVGWDRECCAKGVSKEGLWLSFDVTAEEGKPPRSYAQQESQEVKCPCPDSESGSSSPR